MTLITSLFDNNPHFNWPVGWPGWSVWALMLVVTLFLAYRWRERGSLWSGRQLVLLAAAFVAAPLTSLYLGVRLPAGQALPEPGIPLEPVGPALMLLGALPWVLVAGFSGPVTAAAVAAFSGGLIGLWDTHNPFTPLTYAALAAVFSALVRQRYRTPFFRILRHPPAAGLLITAIYPLLYLPGMLSISSGALPERLDFAITRVGMASLAFGGMVLSAAILAEGAMFVWPALWGERGAERPSPLETSLQARFQYSMALLMGVLVISLMIGDWIVAGNAAQGMLRRSMSETAELGSENVPFFLETGQNLIQQFASDERLLTRSSTELEELLATHLRSAPFFRQLFVLDEAGEPVGGYPFSDFDSLFPAPEELVGIELALQGVAFQYYPIPPLEGDRSAQISFLALIEGAGGERGVLLGRTDMATNPFTKPLIESLDRWAAAAGEGMLVDEQGLILYHPSPSLVMTQYISGAEQESFYEETGPDGTRQFVYYQPVEGRAWAIVLTAPAEQAQQLALNIATPLLSLVVVLSALVVAGMGVGLGRVTSSLRSLAQGAERIARDQLDHPLEVQGVDEVGQLSRAFEEMRVRLQARLEELNLLLKVSQGVAASLELESAVEPILEAAVSTGAPAARIAMAPSAVPELAESESSQFAQGPLADEYAYLDEQVLALTRRQKEVRLTNPARARLLDQDSSRKLPKAMLALALRHESVYYGALWVAYDEPRHFSEEEIRFLNTLAGQAAVAAANAHHYLNAEIGRQKLEAILASTPDPVLVMDEHNRLLLANPAALQVLSDGGEAGQGVPIGQVISQPEILDLLQSSEDEHRAAEISLPGDRYYYARASTVMAGGRQVGRVCVMQDITRFKALDSMKSDFVATVSHDLRSPLTLMRGYATMMQMVGELNEQQTSYVRKILSSVEDMARLVSNLLDLGRIEAGIGLKLEMVPVADLVERVTGTLQLQAVQKRIDLDVEIPGHVSAIVEADPALLQQALQNLVENAIKYTDPGGQVRVRVQERSTNLIFEVADTGIGIAPVDQARLFEKFYRGARREARLQRGSGLGLAIVKSIAERHGGRVWVDSQLGKGSRFYLAIPIRQDQPAQTQSV